MPCYDFEKYKNKNDKKSITGMIRNSLSEIDLFAKDDAFLSTLSIHTNNSHAKECIFKADYYGEISSNINWERFKKIVKEDITRSDYDENDINNKVISILNESGMYLDVQGMKYCEKWKENDFSKYDETLKERLATYYQIKKDSFDLSYNIYLLVYFAVTKQLPKNFNYGEQYEKALNEYNERVTKVFGNNSRPSVREIMLLAEGPNPNIFALLDKADMYYYGNQNNGINQDIVKAFDLYEIAAGLEPIPGSDDRTICHPAAIWSLAYILFNYHRDGTGLEKCKTIPKIEHRYENNMLARMKKVQEYLNMARLSNENDGGEIDNLYGKFSLLTEEDCAGIEEFKESMSIQQAEDYFIRSAEKGYVYAFNNLAMLELDRIFSDPNKLRHHYAKAISHLKQSCALMDPWAFNALGKIYLTGVVERRKHVTYGAIIDSKPVSGKNKREAFKLFEKAAEYFIDSNSGWSIRNLLIEYPDYFIDNQDKMKEYLSKLSISGNHKAINEVKVSLPNLYGKEYESFIE